MRTRCMMEILMVTLVLLRIILVVLLVAANAFFVAAEFAMVSVRDTDRKSTRLNSSHIPLSRMPSSA